VEGVGNYMIMDVNKMWMGGVEVLTREVVHQSLGAASLASQGSQVVGNLEAGLAFPEGRKVRNLVRLSNGIRNA
jgi:hypothetical protein